MSCVNNQYTPDELESIFIWDCLCDAVPLSRAERAAIRERDEEARRNNPRPKITDEEKHAKRLEAYKRYREKNKESLKKYGKAYYDEHREDVIERSRGNYQAQKTDRLL